MAPPKYIPGGAESDPEFDDYDDGYDFDPDFDYHSKPKILPVKKEPMELMKERLLEQVQQNNLTAIKQELDDGPVKGFDIDEKIDHNWNILYYACFLGRPDIVKYLIEERRAHVTMTEDSKTPLMVACYSKADSEDVLKVVKALVKESVNISCADSSGITALMYACSEGHLEVVKYLLSLNDSYDAIDNDGRNALFHAIDGKQVEIAKLLIDVGIDVSVVNKFGYDAKLYAQNENQKEIFELFPAEVYRYETPGNFLSYNRFENLTLGEGSDV